jgi:hypothetical protein
LQRAFRRVASEGAREHMNNRDRFLNLFLGKQIDRAPFLDFMGQWPSTLARWKGEGLQVREGQSPGEAFREAIGFDGGRGRYLPADTFMYPGYEPVELENDGRRILRRNRWGEVVQDFAGSEVMAHALEGPVKDRTTWEHVQEHLQWDTPGRLPADWADVVKEAKGSGETVYAGDLPAGFFGAPRELLTLEVQVMLFYDDPDLMADILDTLCDLWIGLYRRIQEDITLDWCFIWEDMCYKGGPLISPAMFREFLLPRYRRLIAAVRSGGCPLILVDSDGDQRPLTPLWLEAGVDLLMPWESQYGLDLVEVRKAWPKLGIIGGLSEQALEQGREAMNRELAKLPYLLEHGRYIPSVDHNITPRVSWDHVRYFYDRLQELIHRYPPCY